MSFAPLASLAPPAVASAPATATPDARVRQAIAALAVARRVDFDEPEMQVYLHGVADLAAMSVQRACERLSRLQRQPFEPAMPTVGMIRDTALDIEAADRADARRAQLAPTPADADPATWVFCVGCRDGGWKPLRCPGNAGAADSGRDADLPRGFCGRSLSHGAHSFAERCSCVEINPVIARRREARGASSAP